MKNWVKGIFGVVLMGAVVAAEAGTTFPLRVDLDVSTKRSRKMVGAGSNGSVRKESVQCKVKIRKASGQPYTDQLTAELYVIGKQLVSGHFVVVDVIKENFTFSKENDNEFRFDSPVYAAGRTSGNIEAGGVYETFVLVIVDKDGKIVDYRSGRAVAEKGVEFLRKQGPKTVFDRDGNIMGVMEDGANREVMKTAIPAALSEDSDEN